MDNITDITFKLTTGEDVKIGDNITFKYKKHEKYGTAFIEINETVTVGNICRLMDMGVIIKDAAKIAELVEYFDKAGIKPNCQDNYHDYCYKDNTYKMIECHMHKHFNLCFDRHDHSCEKQVSPHCDGVVGFLRADKDDFTVVNCHCSIDLPFDLMDFMNYHVADKLSCNDFWHIMDNILNNKMSLKMVCDMITEVTAGIKDKKFMYRVEEFDVNAIKCIFVVSDDNDYMFSFNAITDNDVIKSYIDDKVPFFRTAIDANECQHLLNHFIELYKQMKNVKNKECSTKHMSRD